MIGKPKNNNKQLQNNDQEGEGSDSSVNLASPSEQMALRAKEELLREGRKRRCTGFTPEDTNEIEIMKKQRRSGASGAIIQKV